MAVRGGAGRRRRRGGSRRLVRAPWRRATLEAVALVAAALIAAIALLGELARAVAGRGIWLHVVPFTGAVLGLGIAAALLLRAWLIARARLAGYASRAPVILALVVAALALLVSRRPAFRREMYELQALVGGTAEAERTSVAHQVWAAYRRTDTAQMLRVLERARVYEPTVREAAAAFGVDPEVLMGVGAAESAFYPRDSSDGGRGLFQITAPPAEAVAEARRRLHVRELDALNQRHNAFLAAATLRLYLDEMSGDLFLALLAYNIGPRNGGLRAAMQQYGARDFVTVQPYLQNLPRDYPIRVLAAALAYRLWRTDGRLPRYEEGDNAARIQQVGVPGLPS
ncbi:MAG: lytic transglycosylase domain-containing protein [Deltaproteobacteria bacterium]|nr:MAG: lytic transglycosylase domain-containing protein [Deltaproteobacteria bacterium]